MHFRLFVHARVAVTIECGVRSKAVYTTEWQWYVAARKVVQHGLSAAIVHRRQQQSSTPSGSTPEPAPRSGASLNGPRK